METVLTAFLVITILLFAVLTLFQAQLAAQDTLQIAWQEMEERTGDQARTDLTSLAAATKSSGSIIEITLRNDGDTRLTDFEQWDVIVQYYTASSKYQVAWLPFVIGEPAHSEWMVLGIYQDAAAATSEMYEPDILNPGEQILLRLRVNPPVGPNSSNLATIAAPNGVTVSAAFTR